jgi:hypothetical protein
MTGSTSMPTAGSALTRNSRTGSLRRHPRPTHSVSCSLSLRGRWQSRLAGVGSASMRRHFVAAARKLRPFGERRPVLAPSGSG